MYATTSALASALAAKRLRLKAVCESATLESDQISNCVYTASIGGADGLTIGGVTAAMVTLQVNQQVDWRDKILTLSVGAEVNGQTQYVPLGTFAVTDCKRLDESTTLTAYDAAYYALGGTYTPTVSSGAAVAAVLADVADQCALSLATLPAAVSTTTVTGDLTGHTCREMVGYLAALVGCNALIDRDGALALRWFSASGQSFGPNDYYNAGLSLDGVTTLNGIQAEVEISTTDKSRNTAVTTNTYTVGGTGAGVTIQNPYMTQAILNAVWASIGGLTCAVGSCSIFHGLLVEPGDLVTITDKAGTAHTLAVMTLELSIDGGCRARIQATADSTTDTSANVSGSMTKQINKIADAVTEFYTIVAQRAKITDLEATNAEIASLKTEKADVKDLTAATGRINSLEADVAETGELIAKKANITDLNAANAEIANLKTEKADVDLLNVAQAVIENLLVRGGIITDSVTGVNINATKYLTGVTIIGDVIEAGTLAADRIILTGDNGLIYELNAKAGNLTATQLTEAQYKQALDGSVLVAKSITTDKLAAGSVTAQVIAAKAVEADHIATGAVTAEKLTVDTALLKKIFAKDIEASNTIKGVTLEGTTINGATINGVTINGVTIKGEAIDIQAAKDGNTVSLYGAPQETDEDITTPGHFDITVKDVTTDGTGTITSVVLVYSHQILMESPEIQLKLPNASEGNISILQNSITVESGRIDFDGKVYINDVKPYITAGDTITVTRVYCAGGVTGSTKNLYFFVPLARPIVDVSSVTLQNPSGAIITARKPAGGYIVQNATVSSMGTATCEAYENGVTISVKASDAYSATNNTPAAVTVENLQLKFT